MGECYGGNFYLSNTAVIQYIFTDEQLHEWNNFKEQSTSVYLSIYWSIYLTIFIEYIYIHLYTSLDSVLRLFINIMYLKLKNKYIKFPHFFFLWYL